MGFFDVLGKGRPMNHGKQTIGQRLKRWRKTSNLRLVGLSGKINVAASSLSELENDKSLPSAETLVKLYYNTNLNILWLLTGKGSMIKADNSVEGNGNFYQDVIPSEHDERLKEMIKKLVRIYQHGGLEKVALMKGFLEGADLDN